MNKKENSNKHFALSKWYMDCITPQGEIFILYVAVLNWFGWTIKYSSILFKKEESPSIYKSSITGVEIPELNEDTIEWNDNKLQFQGKWIQRDEALKETLFKNEEGTLEWKCLQPKSEVVLTYKGEAFQGVGYAELLELNTLPWKIPMDELRWGRYHSEDNTIVWIQYKREQEATWVWLNGKQKFNVQIKDNQLINKAENWQFSLDQGVTLESEKKIFNVLKEIFCYLPGFDKVIPTYFLKSDEKKWFSKGILYNKEEISRGWAIHEYVNFKVNS